MKLLESQQSVETSPDFSASMDGKTSKEGVEIMPMDVLCGRGKNSFNHVGNRKFRDIVADAIPGYVTATSRATKSEIVTSIVRKVRESGGRFLKRDNDRKVWYVLNYTQSKEKAGHAIRDATITEESKKQRARKRKLMRAAAAQNSPRKQVLTVQPSNMSVTEEAHQAEAEAKAAAAAAAAAAAQAAAQQAVVQVQAAQQQQQQQQQAAQAQFMMKDLTNDVKTLDDASSPIECLSSMLMANFPEKFFPEDIPSSGSFEPIPIDDPFNSYIDQLLGPLTELQDLADLADL